MKREIGQFVSECDICQKVQAEHLKPTSWKWEDIRMDFIVGLPRTPKRNDSIWVIIDRLTKTAHFILKYAELYLQRIVALHGVPKTIVSDRGPQFIARFWEQLHTALGTTLIHSYAYHPQTSGQVERVNQVLEDMLHTCALTYGDNWEACLHLAEFTYNNKKFANGSFEALYGRRCRTPLNWSKPGERVIFGPELVTTAEEQVRFIQAKLKTAQTRQQSYADKRRRPLTFEVGNSVYLKVSPTKGVHRFGVTGKLAPRYIGPFPIIEKCGPVVYRLELPSHLSAVHNELDLVYKEYPSKVLDTKEKNNSTTSYQVLQDSMEEPYSG
ncbi:LOW QUALITY PROTEIN: hypothetical protein U9M48_042608 [Paspalum notatum var. saurae]|uniref:Integrase catalytic domain-containing protein n=1 Tax=Paspalum notatum var. saurae TaxID=547442 RepID=A0AAQ3UT72_PASNO